MVAVLVLAVFSPAFSGDFLDWDDNLTVVANVHLETLDLGTLRWAATTFFMGHYQPLTWLSLALDRAIWGLDPRGFHLTNVVLHLLSSLLVYRIVLFVVEHAVSSRPSRPSTVELGWLAAGAASAWALHPQRVESVAWITERRDALSAMLLLLSLWIYLRTHARSRDARSVRRGRLLYGACFALSLLAKASGITFVPVLLILDLLLLERLRSWRDVAGWLRLIAEKWALILLSLVAIGVAPLAQRATEAMVPFDVLPLVDRLYVAAHGWWYYLVRVFDPWPLSPLYELPVPLVHDGGGWFAALALCAAAALALGLLASRGHLAPLLLTALFTLPLLPVLGFFQSGPQLVADRYSYLPTIVAYSLLAWAAARHLPGRRTLQIALGSLGVLLVTWFALLSYDYTRTWRSTLSLWQHAIEVEPSCAYCHEALGLAQLARSEDASAVDHLRRALQIRPNLFKANAALASTLERAGELEAARNHYQLAARLRPDQNFLWQRAALLSEQLEEPARAATFWAQLVRRKPDDQRLVERWFRSLVAAGRCAEVPWDSFPLPDVTRQELRQSCRQELAVSPSPLP